MDDVAERQGKNILVMRNADFLCLFSMTGRGLLCIDPRVPYRQLSPHEDEEATGRAVLAMLEKSSILSTRELNALIKSGMPQERQEIWKAEMSQQYSYKDEHEMFRNVLQIGVRNFGRVIRFSPTRHDKLRHWAGMPSEENIAIPLDSSAKKIGRTLCEAFDKCTNELAH